MIYFSSYILCMIFSWLVLHTTVWDKLLYHIFSTLVYPFNHSISNSLGASFVSWKTPYMWSAVKINISVVADWKPWRAWWRHQMEIFSVLLALCQGIHWSPVNSPHKGQWRGALMFSLICTWINGWVNNHEAGDLRCQRAHYDIIVMERLLTPLLYHW